LRGKRTEYIDPTEAAFYCLPLPTMPIHEKYQKGILGLQVAFYFFLLYIYRLDAEKARQYLQKHQQAILDALMLHYDSKYAITETSVQWDLLAGRSKSAALKLIQMGMQLSCAG
jgi:hypothetical protein